MTDPTAVIEALRAGTVPPTELSSLAVGIDPLLDELGESFAQCSAGQGAVRFVRGEYGAGKSFVARAALQRARAAGFATSWVVVAEGGTRLWRFEEIYREACDGLATATCARGALSELVYQWFGRVAADVEARGVAPGSDGYELAVRAAIASDLLARSGSAMPIDMARTLQAIYDADVADETVVARGLVSWLGGSRNVDASIRRTASIKGDIGPRDALDYMRGVLALIQRAGLRGWVIVVDELEIVLRDGRDARARSLNALRQIVDAAPEFAGLCWVFTGTPEFFDSPRGVAGLAPLHDRIGRLEHEGRASNEQPQIEVAPMEREVLLELARRVRDIYPFARAEAAEAASEAWLGQLVEARTTAFGRKLAVVPRVFVRDLVHRLDLLNEGAPSDEALAAPIAPVAAAPEVPAEAEPPYEVVNVVDG